MTCILLAGEIGAGKSTVALALAECVSAKLVRVRDVLVELLAVGNTDRRALQERGAELDRRTNGEWLVEYLERQIEAGRTFVVDSMRTRIQTVPTLERVEGAFLVYLDAQPTIRRLRFERSQVADAVKRSLSFEAASRHPTEEAVKDLRALSDLVVVTDELDVDEVVSRIVAAIPT